MPDQPSEIIRAALSLDGRSDTLIDFYKRWADRYDEDVAEENYRAPLVIVNRLLQTVPDPPIEIDPTARDLRLLDAGCGTGLVGAELYAKGFRHIDGFDLSQSMIDQAKKLAVYRELKSGIDLSIPLDAYTDRQYDVVLCCGVFTLGHVEPNALLQLISVTRPGGLILTSTRSSYYQNSDYQAVSDRLVADKVIAHIETLWDAPYTSDGDSHYWVYARR